MSLDLLAKIAFLIALWVGSLWGYFHWKFKKEKNVLPPEQDYIP